MTAGKTAGIAGLALCLGFVGGAWFLSSDIAIRKILVPVVPPIPPDLTTVVSPKSGAPPRTEAVALPKEADFTKGEGGLGPLVDRLDLPPAPGCDWVIEPRTFHLGRKWHATNPERALGGYTTLIPAGAHLQFLLIQSTRDSKPSLPLRPVFFETTGARHHGRPAGHNSSRGAGGYFAMDEFVLDSIRELASDKVAYFGIERVRPEAAQLVVDAARRDAEAKGIAILPPPTLGQPYTFDLPAADGTRARSSDHRGHAVVVIASEPGNMSGLFFMMLQQLRKDYTPGEVAFVSISFDGSVDDARRDLAKSNVDGPLVVVPNDAETRRIWIEGSGLDRLPIVFLMDRDGVLRALCTPFELKGRVDALMGRAKPAPVIHPVRAGRAATKSATAPMPVQPPR